MTRKAQQGIWNTNIKTNLVDDRFLEDAMRTLSETILKNQKKLLNLYYMSEDDLSYEKGIFLIVIMG